jgi:murein DD-endopeptidase MepM/ murein hydrolase activator NlpD
LQTRVVEVLTANAATLQAAPPTITLLSSTPVPSLPIPSATATFISAETATPTLTPLPSLSPTPGRATEALSSFPRPPATFAGEPHFYFGYPVVPEVAAFIGSAYRYGSTGVDQLFAPHHGVDYSAGAGVGVVAVAPGTVYYAGNDLERLFGPQTDFYGNLVVLQLFDLWQGHGVYALYGHLDQVLVQTGQVVGSGEVLGTVGATGVALGPHPHLEVRLDFPDSYWDTRNPELWLTPASGTGVLAVRVTNANDQYLPGVYVRALCADGATRRLETYWYSGVNPDDAYGENAAMTHIPAGFCEVGAVILGQTISNTVSIPMGGIGFVWLKP